jgi:hypothetical protein
MPAISNVKTCDVCFRKQKVTQFYKAGRNKNGYFTTCKSCILIATASNNASEAAVFLRRMDRPFIKEL